MKILIIPSWYPTTSYKYSGIFFQEQAFNLNEKDDVKVLYIEHFSLRKLNNFFNFTKHKLLQPPKGVKYSIPNIPILSKYIGKFIAYYFIFTNIKKGWKPDIIRAHGTIWGGYYAVKSGKFFNIPSLVTEHRGPFLLDNFIYFDKIAIKWAIENCTIFSGDGHNAVKSVLLHNFTPKRIEVLGNLINDENFRIHLENKKSTVFKILTITSLNLFYKDFKTFLNSIKHFSKFYKGKYICDVIVVENSIPEWINLFLLENELIDKFNFLLGGIKRNELPTIFNESDVFVSTSITENFGVAMVESLMCGTPVISTRNGGAEDFISNKNGFLTNIKDFCDIGEKLNLIAQKEVIFEKTNVRKTVLYKYGKKSFYENLYRVFHEAILLNKIN
jgi:glycosyltransferase involved in cell wall biosynthesis